MVGYVSDALDGDGEPLIPGYSGRISVKCKVEHTFGGTRKIKPLYQHPKASDVSLLEPDLVEKYIECWV